MSTVMETVQNAKDKLEYELSFIGSVLHRLVVVESDEITTFGADNNRLVVNPAYIVNLTQMELNYIIAFAALRSSLAHFVRREDRDIKVWEVACNYQTNGMLHEYMRDGEIPAGLMRAPCGILHNPAYNADEITSEGIYDLLVEEFKTRRLPLTIDCPVS